MQFLLRAAAFLLGLSIALPTWAASTINPALPASGTPYASTPIRNNFQAAVNDIQALQLMNAGVTAPSAPSLSTLWMSEPVSGTTFTQKIWDGSAWVTQGTLDTALHAWTPTFTASISASSLSLGGSATNAYTILSARGGLSGLLAGGSLESTVSPFTQIAITNDVASVATGTIIPAFDAYHVFGGSGAGSGGRVGIWADLIQQGDMTYPNSTPFHTGIFSNVIALSGASDQAAFYAFAGQADDEIGNHYVLTGGEIDVSLHVAGPRKEGWSLASVPLVSGNDSHHGTT